MKDGRKSQLRFLLLQLSVPGHVCGIARFGDIRASAKYDQFSVTCPTEQRHHYFLIEREEHQAPAPVLQVEPVTTESLVETNPELPRTPQEPPPGPPSPSTGAILLARL